MNRNHESTTFFISISRKLLSTCLLCKWHLQYVVDKFLHCYGMIIFQATNSIQNHDVILYNLIVLCFPYNLFDYSNITVILSHSDATRFYFLWNVIVFNWSTRCIRRWFFQLKLYSCCVALPLNQKIINGIYHQIRSCQSVIIRHLLWLSFIYCHSFCDLIFRVLLF